MGNYDNENMQSNGEHDIAGHEIYIDNDTNDTCYMDNYGIFQQISSGQSSNDSDDDYYTEPREEDQKEDSESNSEVIQDNKDNQNIRGTNYSRTIELAKTSVDYEKEEFKNGIIGIIFIIIVLVIIFGH